MSRPSQSPLLVVPLLLLGLAGPVSGGDNSRTTTGAPSAGSQPPGDELFARIEVLEAATLHTQTLEEAPASEIRKYGYRTLNEALSAVRGFYFTNDRMYDYAGVRGLAIPGGCNILNGNPLTAKIHNSNDFFDPDFGLDMDRIERIEVIRGPSSALFGSSAVLPTINVFTKPPLARRPALAPTQPAAPQLRHAEVASRRLAHHRPAHHRLLRAVRSGRRPSIIR